jgi:hypothetical protein
MSEWWTYAPSDFLMFSPRTYWRLIELYNLEIWPAQIAAAAIGIAIAALLWRGTSGTAPIVAGLLTLVWLWVAGAFLYTRYDTIHLAGRYLAAGFVTQALLVAGFGLAARHFAIATDGLAGRVGLGLFLFALIAYPLTAPLLGRPWAQAELFGLMPDPTAVGTLGVALAWRGAAGAALLLVPLLWCGLSGAQLFAMGDASALIPIGSAGLATAAMSWRARNS